MCTTHGNATRGRGLIEETADGGRGSYQGTEEVQRHLQVHATSHTSVNNDNLCAFYCLLVWITALFLQVTVLLLCS